MLIGMTELAVTAYAEIQEKFNGVGCTDHVRAGETYGELNTVWNTGESLVSTTQLLTTLYKECKEDKTKPCPNEYPLPSAGTGINSSGDELKAAVAAAALARLVLVLAGSGTGVAGGAEGGGMIIQFPKPIGVGGASGKCAAGLAGGSILLCDP